MTIGELTDGLEEVSFRGVRLDDGTVQLGLDGTGVIIKEWPAEVILHDLSTRIQRSVSRNPKDVNCVEIAVYQ